MDLPMEEPKSALVLLGIEPTQIFKVKQVHAPLPHEHAPEPLLLDNRVSKIWRYVSVARLNRRRASRTAAGAGFEHAR